MRKTARRARFYAAQRRQRHILQALLWERFEEFDACAEEPTLLVYG